MRHAAWRAPPVPACRTAGLLRRKRIIRCTCAWWRRRARLPTKRAQAAARQRRPRAGRHVACFLGFRVGYPSRDMYPKPQPYPCRGRAGAGLPAHGAVPHAAHGAHRVLRPPRGRRAGRPAVRGAGRSARIRVRQRQPRPRRARRAGGRRRRGRALRAQLAPGARAGRRHRGAPRGRKRAGASGQTTVLMAS